MEAEKSQDLLQLEGRNSEEPIVEFQAESKRLRIGRADGVISNFSLSLKIGED